MKTNKKRKTFNSTAFRNDIEKVVRKHIQTKEKQDDIFYKVLHAASETNFNDKLNDIISKYIDDFFQKNKCNVEVMNLIVEHFGVVEIERKNVN